MIALSDMCNTGSKTGKHPKSLADCQDLGLCDWSRHEKYIFKGMTEYQNENYSNCGLDVVVLSVEGEEGMGRIEFSHSGPLVHS